MYIGISSACFYPLETEKAVEKLGENGVKEIEIFFNAPSELHPPVLTEIRSILKHYDMSVTSVHPYTSASESYLLFGGYERRFEDSIRLYQEYFHAAQQLGAPYIVIHGSHSIYNIDVDFYSERFVKLIEAGKEFGVLPIQESVVKFASESLQFLQNMKKNLGDDFNMVLDTKQAVRCGIPAEKLLDTFKEDIVHLHLSDYNKKYDCILPGTGEFNFQSFLAKAKEYNPNVSAVIELYRGSFGTIDELLSAQNYLDKLV